MPLEKTFDFRTREPEIQKSWEGPRPARENAKTYDVILPPPNVTGNLHLGHALNTALQDCLVRYHHMRGYNVLWQPGTDHAGIATQTIVERNLEAQGKPSRQEMGRDAFLENVLQWKNQNGNQITRQLRSLGAFCNWERERFTLDEEAKKTVRKVFVTLFQQGLIHQGQRIVNWDPHFQTAISDLEVEHWELKGKLYFIQYRIEDSDESLVIATTRPETLFADTAIAVHPQDPRFLHLRGKKAILPLLERKIPIITDYSVDPEAGTGCLKVTPGHDFKDYEIGKRHDLETLSILDNRACLINIPEPFQHLNGLDIAAARRRTLELLDESLLSSQEHIHSVPHGDRSGCMLEPRITKQWFLDMEPLANKAVQAVHEGKIRFSSEQSKKVFLHFLDNIEPWCISRQLWWGHEIPVWYSEQDPQSAFCAITEQSAQTQADAQYGKSTKIQQDPDVLDTWFSSALWPLITRDWDTDDSIMNSHYPTDILVTGKDILFFWVARMAMMGIHLTGNVPFRKVITHSIIRDSQGQKMSKSKGNTIDPMELSQEYSTDALRLFLLSKCTPDRDLKYFPAHLESSRNFCTKLWNAARFLEIKQCKQDVSYIPQNAIHPINRWINHEILLAEHKMQFSFSQERLDLAADQIRYLVKDVFCDWYLEFAKTLLDDPTRGSETQSNLIYAMQRILALAHPFVPYVTEAIWRDLDLGEGLLIHSEWPDDIKNKTWEAIHDQESGKIGRNTIKIIERIRSIKDDLGIGQGQKSTLFLSHAETMKNGVPCLFRECGDLITKGSRTEGPILSTDRPENTIQIFLENSNQELYMEAGSQESLSKQLARVEQQISKHLKDIQKLANQLENPEFQQKCPKDIFQSKQDTLQELQRQHQRSENVKAAIVEVLENKA